MTMRKMFMSLSAGLLLTIAGCGQSEFEMVSVEGKCTCNGQPMPMGLLVFTPIKPEGLIDQKVHLLGKPAHAEIQEDIFGSSTSRAR